MEWEYHEARDFAIKWARKQGIEVVFHEYRECHVFLRPFDPKRDVIWVSEDVFEGFTDNCWGIHRSDHLRSVSIPFRIGHFALPESMVMDRQSLELLYNTIFSFCGDTVIYIIAGENPDYPSKFVDYTKVQTRWDLCGAQEGGAFVWGRNNKRFDRKGGPRILQHDSYARVLEGIAVLAGILIQFLPDIDFKIRAVRAIRL